MIILVYLGLYRGVDRQELTKLVDKRVVVHPGEGGVLRKLEIRGVVVDGDMGWMVVCGGSDEMTVEDLDAVLKVGDEDEWGVELEVGPGDVEVVVNDGR